MPPLDTKRKNLKSNFAYQASYQVLLIIVPLVTTPYLSRVLGAQAIGVYSYAYTVAGFFAVFATLGVGKYGVRAIAAAGQDRLLRSRTFWGVYAAQALSGTASCVAYAFYVLVMNPTGGILVACVWGMYVLSALLDVSWLLFGVEEFKVPTIRSVVTKLATLPIIFGLVNEPNDVWVYCAAIAGSYLVNQLMLWPFVRRYVDFVRPAWREVLAHFRPMLVLFVPVIAVSLYTTLDKILLGQLADMQQTGFFEYSEKLSKMPLAIVTAMGVVMLPRMSAELSAGHRGRALELLGDSVWVMMAMAMAFAFGISAIAPEFAVVFLGEEFACCDTLMRVLAVIIPVISFGDVIGRQYMIPMRKDVGFTISLCVGAVVNIGTNLVLIPIFGAMGAAIATVVAECAVLGVQAAMVRRELPLAHYLRDAVPFAVCGVLMFVVVRVGAGFFATFWGVGALALLMEIALGAVVFAVLSVVWCAATGDERLRRLISVGKHKQSL